MPYCDWFFEHEQIWACMWSGMDFGGPHVDVVGCEVSCWPCDDVSGLPIGVDAYGQRWLRPALGAESRDATGVRRPISSGVPVLLPRGSTYYELAACWEQKADGTLWEWFGKTICDCNDKCPEILPEGYCLLIGMLHTCFAFEGFRWPPDFFVCTGQYVGHTPIVIPMTTNVLGQAALARTTNRHEVLQSPNTWCTSNFGVFCWGHTVSSDCSQPGGWPEYYNEPHHRLWDFAYVTSFAARFAEHPALPDDFQAAVAARNAVMEFITDDIAAGADGQLHLDQLDSARRFAGPADNFNFVLDYWGRVWNPRSADNWTAFADLPAVMEFPNSKLANTGHPVIAEYVIMGAAIELSMVLHRIKSTPPCTASGPPEETHSIYPLVRMKITVWMGMRVQFPDGAPRYLERTWRDPPDQVPLRIVNGYDQPFPRITPANSDRVVYIDDTERTLAPPPIIVWQGHRGFFSDPPTEDRFHYDLYAGGYRECRAAAAGLDGMLIPAIESHPDNEEGDRKRIWTGSFKFTFPWRDP